MTFGRAIRVLAILGGTILLVACAEQPVSSGGDAPGFLWGIWHGFVAPFAVIGSIFTDVRIYAYPNTGVGYDWGFMIGVFILGGGAAKSF